MGRGRRIVLATMAVLGTLALGAAPAAAAGVKRLFTVNASLGQAVAMARTPDGRLHLVWQTVSGRAFQGLSTMTIAKSGSPGPIISALGGAWGATSQPGLVALPGGTLEAMFGATSPGNVVTVWGITSTNGGATWSAPSDVRDGQSNEALAYASDITATVTGSTPVIALPQAGNIVIQHGFGLGPNSFQLTTPSDGAAGEANLAVDAATGEVVAGWYSIAHNLTDYLQGAWPNQGSVQAVPGQSRNVIIPSGRDIGAGVFAAYTNDGRHVRLLRYGGGSVAVGQRSGTSAKVLGTATGLGGRIWVMWGDDSGGGIALTRSNKAVTRFEPIQRVTTNAFSIYRVSGDGRLGPLDMLINEIPNAKGSVPPPGEFYAHVLPVLSVSGSVANITGKKGKVIGHKLTITVTDAGDAVSGANVKIGSVTKTTNSKGVVSFTFGKSIAFVKATVSEAGYQTLSQRFKL